MPPESIDMKEQNEHTNEYYDQLGWDIKKYLRNKLAGMEKNAKLPNIKIPDVGEDDTEDDIKKHLPVTPLDIDDPVMDLGDVDETNDIGNAEEILSDLDVIEDSLQDIKLVEKIKTIKEELRDEFEGIVRDLKKELKDLKDRKIPEPKNFDSGGVYKEKIFELITRVLDDILVELFEDVPDYSLLATQVSNTFDDGTISDAIVSVKVTVPNDGYRYDFKIDVPILNGIINYPTYIQRGLKVIPLTKQKIHEELDSQSFRKIDVNDDYLKNKGGLFSNSGDNIHRKEDNQKFYEIRNFDPPTAIVPSLSKWDVKNPKGK